MHGLREVSCAGRTVQPVLCSAITASHLALGMPSGIVHVYEIEDFLDQVLVQQAKTVDKISKSWQQVGEEQERAELKELKSNGMIERFLPRASCVCRCYGVSCVPVSRTSFQDHALCLLDARVKFILPQWRLIRLQPCQGELLTARAAHSTVLKLLMLSLIHI